ncbi:lipocalin-like 1 protein [Macrotis lagotis]|uniref:lipocalin-like 1 protein n=1 Tax=Macrotis lagotis TaxID=92651 RepID=UPI003D681075
MMKAVLLGCLLGLLWGSPIQADIPVQPNFDNTKFQGLWYIVAAASDDNDFLAMKDNMKMPITFVTPLDNGDLSVKTAFPGPNGDCQKVDATFTKGAMPGQFSNPSMGQEDISVVSSDYKHYAILCIRMNKGGAQTVMLQLYCRSPELFAEGAQRMQMMAPKVNLNPSQGAIFPKSDECDKALSKGTLEEIIDNNVVLLHWANWGSNQHNSGLSWFTLIQEGLWNSLLASVPWANF